MCLKLAISKGPNRVRVSLTSTEDGNSYSFRNVVFCSYLEIQTTNKFRNPVVMNVIHHCQNPLASTCEIIVSHDLDLSFRQAVDRIILLGWNSNVFPECIAFLILPSTTFTFVTVAPTHELFFKNSDTF
jgi:hypothetical protein